MNKKIIIGFLLLGSFGISAQNTTLLEWNFDNGIEGWILKVDNLPWSVENGILKLEAQDGDPYMSSPDNLNVSAEVHTEIMVRMRSYGSSPSGQIYFSTSVNPGYSEAMRIDFPLVPNDTDFTDYYIDMTQNTNWTGTIKQFRFDPGGVGFYDIDFIRVRGYVCESQTIEFSDIGEKLVSDAPFQISATSSSGLAVDYTLLAGPASLNGDLLSLSGEPGYIVLAANQAGDDVYCSAEETRQGFYAKDGSSITKSPQVISEGDQWIATDGLGRTISSFEDVGESRSGKYVGLFYFTWQGNHNTTRVLDITKLIQENPDNPAFGNQGEFHWWGESEDGYYKADDPWVIRRQLEMISAAGVDFIYIDVTNAFTYLSTVEEVCRISEEMRLNGIQTPYIAFVSNSNSGQVINQLFDQIYTLEKYKDLWFIWDGRPLIFGDISDTNLRDDARNFFTIRYSWHNTDTKNNPFHWQWNDYYPQDYGWDLSADIPTQIPVSKASHPVNTLLGGSFSNGAQPPIDQYALTEFTGQGRYLSEQFEQALKVDPEVVMITGWNEWIAQKQVATSSSTPLFLGKPTSVGDPFFVDCYNQEFNRDIAPMKGGHTDNHYYLMLDYIRKFKGMETPRAFSPSQSISIDANFSEWESISPVYKDYEGDIALRSFMSFGNQTTYVNSTGRNDIIESRTVYDESNVYFYVKTAQDLSSYTDSNWMLLLLDVDRNTASGWEGYDYIVNYGITSNTQTSLKKWNGTSWVEQAQINYSYFGNEMEISIPRSTINMSTGTPEFYFHWADNPQHLIDISAFFTDGESAPDRRFNYNYSNSKPAVNEQVAFKTLTIPGVIEFEDFDEGGIGVAYADSDIENNGGEYRPTESVDIKEKTDGGYCISWINSGEWLEYTVNINAVGEFVASIYYASNVDTNEVIMYLNETDISDVITLPSTGGIDIWGSVDIPIQLNASTRTLKFFIKNAASNLSLDKIEFVEENVAYPGTGEGLWKSLWNGADGGRSWFEDSICAEIDPFINEVWADESPGCEIKNDFWNIRWEGQIEALFSETYTFYLTVNDIARLWVDDQLLFDLWATTTPNHIYTNTMDLTAGEKLDFRLDFGDKLGSADIKLEWSSDSNLREVIPQSQFYPIITTGISQKKWKNPLIYPNPVENTIYISANGANIEQVIIYDLQGRVVFVDSERITEIKSIDVQSWEKGMYFIKFECEGYLSNQKVIIK